MYVISLEFYNNHYYQNRGLQKIISKLGKVANACIPELWQGTKENQQYKVTLGYRSGFKDSMGYLMPHLKTNKIIINQQINT